MLGAGVVEADVAELEHAAADDVADGAAGGTTEGSVSSTSWIRPADDGGPRDHRDA